MRTVSVSRGDERSDVALAIEVARELMEAGRYREAGRALDMARGRLGETAGSLRARLARVYGPAAAWHGPAGRDAAEDTIQ